MEILSVFKAVLTPQKDQTAESLNYLKPGDKLIGKVLRMEADGRVLIDLGRVQALAQTTVPVQVGQQLPLKVIQTGQPIQLRLDEAAGAKPQNPLPQIDLGALFTTDIQQRTPQIIDRLLALAAEGRQPVQTPEAAQDVLKQVAGDLTPVSVQSPQGAQTFEAALVRKQGLPESVRQALMQLKSVLEPLAMNEPIARQTEWVQSAVENRGMLFEVKLAHMLEKGTPAQTPTEQMAVAPKPQPNLAAGGGKTTVDNLAGAQTDTQTETGGGNDPLALFALKNEVRIAPQIITGRLPEGALPSTSAQKQDVVLPDTTHRVVEQMVEQGVDGAVKILAHDLKPQLLVLKSYFSPLGSQVSESADPIVKEADLLRQVVERVLSHVEEQQQQAVKRAGESEVYQVFTHLLPIKEQSMPVKLKVYYPNKGGPARDDPQHRVALLLDMDQLGLVRADLSMIERHLRIQFYVRDESVQSLFDSQSQSVIDALEGIFNQVQVDTRVSKEKISQFDGEDFQGPPLGRIDVKA